MTNKDNKKTDPEKKYVQSEVEKNDSRMKKKETAASSDKTVSSNKTDETQQKPPKDKVISSDSNKNDEKKNTSLKGQPVLSAEKLSKRGVKLGTTAILLSLILAGGAGWMVTQQSDSHQAQITQLEMQIKSLNEQFEQRLAVAEAAAEAKADNAYDKAEIIISQQQKSIKSLQLALADVKGRHPNNWLLAESDYLVKLAGRKLFLEKDVVSATKLMESADQRVSVLNDPSLVPLRQDMAKDITTLKSIPLIDKDGLTLRLISLQKLVDTLPLANAILPESPITENKVITDNINDWKDNLYISLNDFFEQFITFRTREGNVIPLLSPEQHYYLKENIKGKIETAIRAIYNENQAIYESALLTADEWAMQFFKLDDPAAMQFSRSMQQLAKQNIQVDYPVKLVSQKALSDVINERLRRQVTSMTTETN